MMIAVRMPVVLFHRAAEKEIRRARIADRPVTVRALQLSDLDEPTVGRRAATAQDGLRKRLARSIGRPVSVDGQGAFAHPWPALPVMEAQIRARRVAAERPLGARRMFIPRCQPQPVRLADRRVAADPHRDRNLRSALAGSPPAAQLVVFVLSPVLAFDRSAHMPTPFTITTQPRGARPQ